jgi:hypothetical protein
VGRNYEILATVPASHHAFKVATSALCWMALDASGSRDPKVVSAMQRCLDYLVKNGRVKRPGGIEFYNVWAFGYGLQALARAPQREDSGSADGEIREAAAGLVEALGIYQVPDGGWGYLDFDLKSYHPTGSSTPFTTGTILIALYEARAQGIEVPRGMINKAVRAIRRCRKKDGSYLYGTYLRYQPMRGINQHTGSAMRNPNCDLALHLSDQRVGVEDMTRNMAVFESTHRFSVAAMRRPIPHESWYSISGYFYLYGHRYAGMVLGYLSEEAQRQYWPIVVKGVLKARQQDGSFWDYPLYGYHKFYGTGYAVETLSRCPKPIAESL